MFAPSVVLVFRRCGTVNFVPKHREIRDDDIQQFNNFLKSHDRLLVLTGAGMSTECGIPDYRSESVGLYSNANYKPTLYQEFVKNSFARNRYWARSFLGWPRIANTIPSPAMKALASMKNVQLITQNVDGLHEKAGSKNVVELHGSLYRVICMQCNDISSRHILQQRLLDLNSTMKKEIEEIRPDGDVDISEEQVRNFKTADCEKCGGILKPDIVFFGDNVPSSRVQKVKNMVQTNDALLVLGSSLSIYSSFRIVSLAHDLKKVIFLINIGNTRADKLATVKLNVQINDIFKATKC